MNCIPNWNFVFIYVKLWFQDALDASDESSLEANGKASGVSSFPVTDDNTSTSLPDDLSANDDSSDQPPAKKPKPDSKWPNKPFFFKEKIKRN